MSHDRESFLHRARRRGQVLLVMVGSLTVFLGFAGLTVDVGQLYVSFRELQMATEAAALAGAQALPNTSATTTAIAYSAVSGGLNAHTNLPNVTMVSGYPAFECYSTLTIPCVAPANANAIQVQQQVTVPLTFMRLFGKSSFTLNAVATAAMRGSGRAPYNVAMILDTSDSMNNTDKDADCSDTRLNCALQGMQVFLKDLSPCASNLANCGSATGGVVPNAVDSVGLYAFPPLVSATPDTCGGGSLTAEAYTFAAPSSSYTYQIVPFASDYRSSDTATTLTASSTLVKAVGATNDTGCMKIKGGQGTYYAQAIEAAQADLVAAHTARPNTQNVMIILSDGDASNGKLTAVSPAKLNTNGSYTVSGGVNGPGSSTDMCQQAVTVAQAATAAGTRVYTVAYGSGTSGCTKDSPSITPCQTMANMASKVQETFFSDISTLNTKACPSGRPTTSLNQIFTEIAGDLTLARLIPNTTQ